LKPVKYIPSAEHKRSPGPWGNPHLQTDNSVCEDVDPGLGRDERVPLVILQELMDRGQADSIEENSYPRHLWGWITTSLGEKRLVEARLTNQGQGWYKGYFIDLNDLSGDVRRNLKDGGKWSEAIRYGL